MCKTIRSLLPPLFGIMLFSLLFFLAAGCSGNRIQKQMLKPGAVSSSQNQDTNSSTKFHMKNGDVYLLHNWNSDSVKISGLGSLYDYNRILVKTASFEIPLEDIALAETNSIKESASSSLLMIPTVLTGIAAGICAANPKACFGSCPTFYTSDGKDYVIRAEGFSAAVSKCLEEEDVDALYHYEPETQNLELLLRNEAYETHFIRKADVLALPHKEGSRVFSAGNGRFFEVSSLVNPVSIQGPEGDCSEKLCDYDGDERCSNADSNDLAEKEIIELSFDCAAPGKKGIVIASRQSLLMTYIFYQSLAFMGSSAGNYFAQLERDTTSWKNIMKNVRSGLGGIEVFVSTDGNSWKGIGETGEFGPIASDIKLLPFESAIQTCSLKVRLQMTKGFWRIDYVSLADISEEVSSLRIQPSESYPVSDRKGSPVIDLLQDDDSLLVTFPGDKYLLHYKLPINPQTYDYFIDTRGYYIEWMREEWIKEEDPLMVYEMFFNHQKYFKDLAPRYKMIESEMEESFRSSKYVTP